MATLQVVRLSEKERILPLFSLFSQAQKGNQLSASLASVPANSVTRSRDFARKWRFLEAARALKIGPRALREF